MGPAFQFPPQPRVRFDKIIEDIGLVYCALADRQRAAVFDIFCRRMQELLRQIDLEYYRSARLLIARAILQQLRQESLALANVERKKAVPRGRLTCVMASPRRTPAAAPAVLISAFLCRSARIIGCREFI
jgi:hypothetical protein